MGKQRMVKFSSGKHTSTGILEYVHSYLWGSPRELNLIMVAAILLHSLMTTLERFRCNF